MYIPEEIETNLQAAINSLLSVLKDNAPTGLSAQRIESAISKLQSALRDLAVAGSCRP